METEFCSARTLHVPSFLIWDFAILLYSVTVPINTKEIIFKYI